MGNAVIQYINWSKVYCRQSQATRRKWFRVIKL